MDSAEKPGKEIELRSDEVREILGHIPHWIIRWGTVLIFIFLALLLIGSWWFRYPDMVRAEILVTTEYTPSHAVARTSGKIMKIFVKDNQQVSDGQVLALIENPAREADIEKARETGLRFLEETEWQVSETMQNLSLGEIQPAYAGFIKLSDDYRQFLELDYHRKKINSLREEILRYEDYSRRLVSQGKILKQEESLSYSQFLRDSTLFAQGVVPEAEFEKTKSSWLQKKFTSEQSGITLASNEITIAKLSREILDLTLKRTEEEGVLKSALAEAAKNLLGEIAAWELKYVLKSHVNGTVTFTRIWSENQDVREGDLVMSVIPANTGQIIGKLGLPLSGAGKVRAGQWVNIKFDNFPYLEFGIVRGRVKAVSLVTSDNQYSVIVELPEGLKTGYGNTLEFSQDMKGTAEIITNDRRLLERIVLPVRAVFSRQKHLSEQESILNP